MMAASTVAPARSQPQPFHRARRAARGGRRAVGQVHGPDGPARPRARRRAVADRVERHPHDVHALRDRRRLPREARSGARGGTSRRVRPSRVCGPGPGSFRWCAARTACWSSPSARSSGAGRPSATSSRWSRPTPGKGRITGVPAVTAGRALPAIIARWPLCAGSAEPRSISRSRPPVPGAVARDRPCARPVDRHSTPGWRCPAGRRSGFPRTSRRRSSSWNGARRSPDRSGPRSTT